MARMYEEKYLLTLLSAILNQRQPPAPVRRVDWEDLFRLADYHNVANVAYYGLLAVETNVPKVWKERFFEKYRETVLQSDRFIETEKTLIKMMERSKIFCMVLNGRILTECYPIQEMRYLNALEIFVDESDLKRARKVLEDMDFIEKESRLYNGILFYKIPGIRVVVYPKFQFFSKKVKSYFSTLIPETPLIDGCQFIHEMPESEYYIYQVCSLADSYARGEISISALLDFWVYYRAYQSNINWYYVVGAISKMELGEFAEHLENLMFIWFGVGESGEEPEVYEAMEAYIMSKGIDGREISSKLLPLIRTVADFYRRDRQKEQLHKLKAWLFPEKEYMEIIYPILTKAGWLMPVCWLIRLIRSTLYFVKYKISRKLAPVSQSLRRIRVMSKWNARKRRQKRRNRKTLPTVGVTPSRNEIVTETDAGRAGALAAEESGAGGNENKMYVEEPESKEHQNIQEEIDEKTLEKT